MSTDNNRNDHSQPLQSNTGSGPFGWLKRFGMPIFVIMAILVIFNAQIQSEWFLDFQNADEMDMVWPDEGRHVRMLEHIQKTGSLKLLHPAYTALHLHLSYFFSWLANGFQSPMPSSVFITSSQIASWVSTQAFLLVIFAWAYTALGSFPWAYLALGLTAAQRFSMYFATRLHPESTMMLFVALTLWMATLFLHRGKVRYLYAMCLFTAMAVGAKAQSVFLVPWDIFIFFWGIWRQRIRDYRRILLWGTLSCLFAALGFLVASPYQFLNLGEWLHGLLWEQNNLSQYNVEQSRWKWFEVLASDAVLGPIYAVMFGISLFISGFYSIPILKKQGLRSQNLPVLFFLVNLTWIVVGTTYIVIAYTVFTTRYLLHIQYSAVMIILLALYWGIPSLSSKHKKWVIPLVVLLIWGGSQLQWKRAMRDNDKRMAISKLLPAHRDAFEELIELIPGNARIYYTINVYIRETHFPNISWAIKRKQRIGREIDEKWVKTHDFDYLIMTYRGHEDIRKMLRDVRMDHVLEGIRNFPEIEIAVYRKITTPQ